MRAAILALCLAPTFVVAAGSDTSTPPASTETTTTCQTGLVWDAASKSCVAPKDSRLDDDQRYEAVRELAYAGRITEAQAVLAAMDVQESSRVQTYWGFTYGKLGQLDRALSHYARALVLEPSNALARSYRGQALVAAGRIEEARVELAQIAASGQSQSWAAQSLKSALQSGKGYNY